MLTFFYSFRSERYLGKAHDEIRQSRTIHVLPDRVVPAKLKAGKGDTIFSLVTGLKAGLAVGFIAGFGLVAGAFF